MKLTKKNLKQALHVAYLAVSVAAVVVVWLSGLSLKEKTLASLGVVTGVLSQLKTALGKGNELIDQLPIPDDVVVVQQPLAVDAPKDKQS